MRCRARCPHRAVLRHSIRRNKKAVIANQRARWCGISAAALSSEQPPAGRLLASRNPFPRAKRGCYPWCELEPCPASGGILFCRSREKYAKAALIGLLQTCASPRIDSINVSVQVFRIWSPMRFVPTRRPMSGWRGVPPFGITLYPQKPAGNAAFGVPRHSIRRTDKPL